MPALPEAEPAPATTPSDEVADAESRYSRQILFPGIGRSGQALLGRAHVGIVGVGATGAASASLLARAGIGQLTLIDRDFVEASNLQRQSLFEESDARDSLPKSVAARDRLHAINSDLRISSHVSDLVPSNIDPLLRSCDLILDGTDNFETRFLLNDYAVQQGKPWIYAAAVGAYAATMPILPKCSPKAGETPPYTPGACLACLFPEPPTGPTETCDTAGILGTAVQLAASLQVNEALKILTGAWPEVRRTLLSVEMWTPRYGRLEHAEINAATPRVDCAVCGARIFRALAGSERPHISLCGRNSVQIHERRRPLDIEALKLRLQQLPELSDVRSNSMLLRFRRAEHTVTLFPDGRAVIQGTTEPAVARALYARFVGS